MLKALLLELLRPYIEGEKPSCTKVVVYCFIVMGLSLLIAANYCAYFHSQDSFNVVVLMGSGTMLITIAVIIESLKCYLKYKNRYKTFNTLKASGKELINLATGKANNLVIWGKVVSYLPLIIRIIPSSILTLIIYKAMKRAILLWFRK